MERKEGLRVGEGGLTGGNPQVSLRIVPSLIFFNTNSLLQSAANAIMTITDSCTYLFALFNNVYLDTNESPILSTVAFAKTTASGSLSRILLFRVELALSAFP